MESKPKRYRVCMSWGSREEGTFEEVFTADNEDAAEEACRLAMAYSESDTPDDAGALREAIEENREYWYLIHCIPEPDAESTLRQFVGEVYESCGDLESLLELLATWRGDSVIAEAIAAREAQNEGVKTDA